MGLKIYYTRTHINIFVRAGRFIKTTNDATFHWSVIIVTNHELHFRVFFSSANRIFGAESFKPYSLHAIAQLINVDSDDDTMFGKMISCGRKSIIWLKSTFISTKMSEFIKMNIWWIVWNASNRESERMVVVVVVVGGRWRKRCEERERQDGIHTIQPKFTDKMRAGVGVGLLLTHSNKAHWTRKIVKRNSFPCWNWFLGNCWTVINQIIINKMQTKLNCKMKKKWNENEVNRLNSEN